MNERIKEFALESGLAYKMNNGKYWIDAGEVDIHLERFAELVRQDERELCASLCDKASYWDGHVAANCAAAIRTRGEK